MEQSWKQPKFWPEKITPEEINEKLRKAANRDKEKGKDLVSEEEITEAIEGEGNKPGKISFKENLKRVQKILENLKEKEKNRDIEKEEKHD